MKHFYMFSALLVFIIITGCNLETDLKDPESLDGHISTFNRSQSQCAKNFEQRLTQQKENVVVLDGRVVTMVEDNIDGSHVEKLNFLTSNDEYLQLEHFKDNNLPKNIQIQLAFEKTVSNKLEPIVINKEFVAQTDCIDHAHSLSSKSITATKKSVGIFYMENESSDPTLLDLRIKPVRDYFTKVAKNQWDITIKAYAVDKNCPNGLTTSCLSSWENKIKNLSSEYGHNYTVAVYDFRDPNNCGRAGIGQNFAQVFAGCKGPYTIIHELSHNFGLHHAKSPTLEYGDYTSIMGQNRSNALYNAAQSYHLNLLPKVGFRDVNSTQRIKLIPQHSNTSDINLTKIARIEKNDFEYFVTTRFVSDEKEFGIPLYGDDREVLRQKVFIHSWLSTRHSYLHDSLAIGESFIDEDRKLRIHFKEINSDNQIVLDVYYNLNDNEPLFHDEPPVDPNPTCEAGFILVDNKCVKIDSPDAIIINLSNEKPNGAQARVFKLNEDILFWRIKNAGFNLKVCAQFQGTGSYSNRSNWGRCAGLPKDSPKWSQLKDQLLDSSYSNPWYWGIKNEVWVQKEDLTDKADHYYFPGRFKFYLLNPDNGERKQIEIQIVE